MNLKDLSFSDIYIGEAASWLAGVPQLGDPVPAPYEVAYDISQLRQKCLKTQQERNRLEFSVRHDGVAYRASTLKSLEENVFVLRRFPIEVPDLANLNIHGRIVNMLMTPKLTGMIIIAGAFGQGKTTTASSIVKQRISNFGGVCVAIEDPPEMPLEGRHGEGVCYQTEVEKGEFGEACRLAARWAPSIIFLGEIRDSETAAEALRASINGRLVVCTIHADNIISAIERLYQLACGSAGSADDVSSLMANGLACILHQRLDGEPRRPKVQVLWLKGDEAHGARNLIRLRKWAQINSEINLQYNRLFTALPENVVAGSRPAHPNNTAPSPVQPQVNNTPQNSSRPPQHAHGQAQPVRNPQPQPQPQPAPPPPQTPPPEAPPRTGFASRFPFGRSNH